MLCPYVCRAATCRGSTECFAFVGQTKKEDSGQEDPTVRNSSAIRLHGTNSSFPFFIVYVQTLSPAPVGCRSGHRSPLTFVTHDIRVFGRKLLDGVPHRDRCARKERCHRG